MKKLLILFVAILLADTSSAQTWSEWFRQKQTQKKYLLQQIAALQVYSDFLLKGYSIAKNGLSTIQNIKHGDFNLHNNYFTSLVSVNSKVKHYSKVAEVIAIQVSIAKQIFNAISGLSKNDQFSNTEIVYFKNVFNNLLADCTKNLDELYNLITDGSLQLKDDERILAIDKIYDDMQDKKTFTISFCNNALGLCIQRSNEVNDVIISKKLNNLK